MTAQASLARTQLLLRVLAVAVLLTWIAAAHGVGWAWASALLSAAVLGGGITVLVRVGRGGHPRSLAVGAVAGMLVGLLLGLYSAAALAFAGQVARFEDCSHHAITITAKDSCQADLRAGLAAAASRG